MRVCGQGAPARGRTLTWSILRWLTLIGALGAATGSPAGACAADGSPPRPPAPAHAQAIGGRVGAPAPLCLAESARARTACQRGLASTHDIAAGHERGT